MNQDPIKIRLKAFMTLHRAWLLVWSAAPRWTIANFVVMLVQATLPLLALVLLKKIVDSLTVALASADSSFLQVAVWIGLAGLVALLTAVVNAFGSHATEAQGLAVTDHVSDVIHGQSVAVDLEYYDTPSFHDTLHLTQQDAPYRPARIVNGLKQTLLSGLTLLGIVWLLFTFHWAVGLALLFAALPVGIVRLLYARQLFSFERDRAEIERQAWYYHWLMTSVDYARDIRLFGIGPLFAERFRGLRTKMREGRLDISARRTRREVLAQGAAITALYVTLGGMAYFAVQGSVTLGVIVMYFQGYQRALTALQNVLEGLAWLYEDNLFLRHFQEFIDLPSTVEKPAGETLVPNAADSGLVIQDLSFTYPSRSEPTLKGVNLELCPGEIVALVGVNGSGKTTLAKLVSRLYDPQSGSVSWEGRSLKEFQAAAWRRQVSVVSQDFACFDMTIGENIWLGDVDRDSTPELLNEAAKVSGADRVIDQFEDGLETQLGTHFQSGQELSVGEWQRLALARAWYRDAQLMIFDEPSSALDPLAEAEMINSFKNIIGKRCALLISHRLSSVRLADRIYVMEDGQVIEQGRHDDLLLLNGAYARFFRAQAEYYKD
jgi:ATP-binding cassette subfamily B protein